MNPDEIQPPVDPADVRDDGELVDGRVVVMERAETEWVGVSRVTGQANTGLV